LQQLIGNTARGRNHYYIDAMSSLLLPLILFLGFIGFRIASIMATRKREAQLRAAWRAEVDATRGAIATQVQALDAPLRQLIAETSRVQQLAERSPAEMSASLAAIAGAGDELRAAVEALRVVSARGPAS
jgi:hypothetical protein